MASYVKGEKVANATSYELAEKKSGGYTKLAEKSEINFDLSTLGLSAGEHTLVVKAKADGYEDSDYSNEIQYTQESSGETTWYIDHRAQESSFTTPLNIGGRGWCVADTNAAYKKIAGVPINTAHFFTSKATQQVAVMKISAKNASSGELIATVTANKDASGNFAVIEFPTVTLQQGEYLSLFSADDADIDFKYASAAVVDANGVSDKDFYTRVPKIYGSGTVWSVAAGSLGWSFGYKA